MAIEFTGKVEKWHGIYRILIPDDLLKKENLKEGDEVVVLFRTSK